MTAGSVLRLILTGVGMALASTAAVYFLKTAVAPASTVEGGLCRQAVVVLTNIRLWIGLMFYGVAAAVFAWGLMRTDVTQMVPVAMGISLIATALMAVVVLGETPPITRIVGMGVLVLGIVLVSSA